MARLLRFLQSDEGRRLESGSSRKLVLVLQKECLLYEVQPSCLGGKDGLTMVNL